jgi:hypothetical protein
MSRYPLFDRSQINLRSLTERQHDVPAWSCAPLVRPESAYDHPEWNELVDRMLQARDRGRPVLMMMGAHVIKQGLSRYVIDLMRRGLVTHVATNGAGIIHDFELALVGGTSEDVARYVRRGEFGLWEETGRLNDIVAEAASRREGLGEAVGRTIDHAGFPWSDLSIGAAGWRLGVPVTSHVTVGADIIHAHANCDAAAWGAASYTDFLIFAQAVRQLEGGVFLNVGSAVTGPEVYLKALSMARNVARQQGQEIRRFTTAVFDLVELPANFRQGAPDKSHPQYYYRPWKTILVRTVADGGQSYYFRGDHRVTIPSLHHELTSRQRCPSEVRLAS